MAFPDWSSLPPELINRIAGCFLATNDIDHYMDFPAVCSNWRSATDDPKNSSDIRFLPRLWVIIDEVFHSDARLLVNTTTGRAVRKDLPLLRNYYVIATTTPGGSIVLADREYPHALNLLNPFTGGLFRFMARMPSEMHITAAVYYDSSSPTLFLFSDRSPTMYKTDPERECCTVFEDKLWYHMIRLALKGGMMCTGGGDQGAATEPLSFSVPKILDLMKRYAVDPPVMCSDTDVYNLPRTGNDNSCFLVKSDGEELIILKLRHCVEVFKMGTVDKDVIEPVESIGNHTIFIGYRRCLSVRADKFPTIKVNCIYYVKSFLEYSSMEIYVYDLKEKKEEKISGAIYSLLPISLSEFARPPFTITQLLCSYTSNVRESQWTEKWVSDFHLDFNPELHQPDD